MSNRKLVFMRSSLRRLTLGALALTALTPFASAGTYSIVSVTWATTPTTADTGSMVFDTSGNPFDVLYGCNKTIYAPVGLTDSVMANPSAIGVWRYRIRWVGAVGETPPNTVNLTVKFAGSSAVSTVADCHDPAGVGTATAEIADDPFFAIPTITSYADSSYPQDFDNASVSYQVVPMNLTTSMFVNTTGTTYEATSDLGVGFQCPLYAYGHQEVAFYSHGLPVYKLYGGAGASAVLGVKVRLTHIGGTRVQADP